jgi:ribonuclease HI
MTPDHPKIFVEIKLKPKIIPSIPESDMESKYYSHPDYNPDCNIIHIYTDGSAYENGSTTATGGYGVFFGTRKINNITTRLTCGKITNNVAELSAIIAAMNTIHSLSIIYPNMKYLIHYDSKYAAGVTMGTMKAHTNLELVKESKTLYASVCQYCTFEHIKAHTGYNDLHSIGNHIADCLAKGV